MAILNVGSIGSVFRSKVLFHATAQSMGCPHTPYSMANCWHHSHPHPDSVSLWEGMRAGAKPQDNNQTKLFGDFPHLHTLFENPFWSAISHPEWTMEWDELADSIRVGGIALDGCSGKLTRLLRDRVDWPCLGVHLVLHQTQDTRFFHHRLWLKDNLAAMVRLCSMQRPMSFVRTEFQDFLFRMISGGHAPKVIMQSCAAEKFANETLFEFLLRRQWLHGEDQHLALLIWNFRQQLQHELDIGPPQTMGPAGCGLPHSLRQKWYRKRSQWMDHPIHLNGVCCEFGDQYA
ncbi:hypothetical protein [Pseudomonas asiatica]|uniref:hypothetical protein n=1 Tax=Pseudomonas asiatica TaxID=2219225 RepID=UPI0027995EDC|nr:hypothetical protein QIY50_25455 [Pseudomonas putida]